MTASTIDPARIAAIPPLTSGSHAGIGEGANMMEAASYIAGEPWSDHPECVCPVIGAFLRIWNDVLSDDERDALLRPLILRIVGTKATPDVERRRGLMAADWLVREHAPAWLRVVGLAAHADALAALPEITDKTPVASIRSAIDAARTDAAGAMDGAEWVAAQDAIEVADKAAAWAGAWAGPWAGTLDATRAAGLAAGRAGADWGTSWDQADFAASRDALAPTRLALRQSALRLGERMIAAEDADAAR